MAIAPDKVNAGTAIDDNAGTTLGVSTTQAVASGGLIVASVMWWHATATLTSVSGGGLSWAIAVQGKHTTQNPGAAIAYAQAPSGLASSTTLTANYSTSVNGRGIGITSFTGAATSTPVDVTAGPLDQFDAWTSGSLTLAAGSVLVAFSHLDVLGSSTITGPSAEALDWNDSANLAGTTGYQIGTTAGSYTVAGTWNTVTNAVTVAAAFKVATASTTSMPPLPPRSSLYSR